MTISFLSAENLHLKIHDYQLIIGCIASIEESLGILANSTEANATIAKETPGISKNIGEISNKLDKVLSILQNGDKSTHQKAPEGAQFFKWDPKGYCHTHGYKVVIGHDSKTCSMACSKAGHQKDATPNNPMGGSKVNKNWVPSYHEKIGYWVELPPRRGPK